MRTSTSTWQRGQKSQLAKAVGISLQYLCDIPSGRKRALPELARRIETESSKLGLEIHRLDVLYPEETLNPLIG